MKNLPNLYPLRFFLSVIVIIYHIPLISRTIQIPYYNAAPIFRKGMLAVYYFFSLSGFLILRLVYNEIASTKDFNFRHFYLRRIQRLYPVYYLVILIGVLFYFVVLPHLGIANKANYSLVKLISYYVLLIPNVFRYEYGNTGSILIILWSIGVEEQFYLFMPVFMYFFRKKLLYSVVFLLLILILLLFFVPSFYKYSNYYFYFVFGGLLSIISLHRQEPIFKNKWLQIVIYMLCLLSFSTSLFDFQNAFLFHSFNMLVGGLLITIISDYPLFVINSKLLNFLGKISYGVYAYHMIIITGILFLVNRYKLSSDLNSFALIVLLNITIIIATVITASISYNYFESLFYKKNNK